MHETSLIEYTLIAVEKKASLMGIERVAEIGLVVGRLAAVPHLMETAFNVMKYGRPMFTETKLVIDYRDLSFCCRDCQEEFTTDSYIEARCPACGGTHLKRTGGDELLIDYFIPEDTV